MVMRDEEPTRVFCERCRGDGWRKSVVEEGTTHRAMTEREPCFVCEGLGAAIPTVLARWITLGRPDAKPAGW